MNLVYLGPPTDRIQRGGVKLSVAAAGATLSGGKYIAPLGDTTDPSYAFVGQTDTGLSRANGVLGLIYSGTPIAGVSGAGFQVNSSLPIGWGGGNPNASPDTVLYRDAANVIAQRNGTTAQALRIYKTYAAAGVDFERAYFRVNGSVWEWGVENGGTGSARNLKLQTMTSGGAAQTQLELQTDGRVNFSGAFSLQGNRIESTGNGSLRLTHNGPSAAIVIGSDTVTKTGAGQLELTAPDVIYTLRRNSLAKGADVAAANDLTLGLDGNAFIITGNTQINAITTAKWTAGAVIVLEFTGTPTVKHNTAGGAGTALILLAGAADFVASANDNLTLWYNGTTWNEIGRTVI